MATARRSRTEHCAGQGCGSLHLLASPVSSWARTGPWMLLIGPWAGPSALTTITHQQQRYSRYGAVHHHSSNLMGGAVNSLEL